MRNELVNILPKLRRFAYALTGAVHDADDLLQATVERLLVKGVPEHVLLDKWAFRVCRNLWIDEIRKQKVRAAIDIDDACLPVSKDESERQLHNSITLAQVNQAMDELSEDQRTSLAMFAFGGFSYAEIADALEVPTGTVMSRIARARKSLAARFEVNLAPKAKVIPIDARRQASLG